MLDKNNKFDDLEFSLSDNGESYVAVYGRGWVTYGGFTVNVCHIDSFNLPADSIRGEFAWRINMSGSEITSVDRFDTLASALADVKAYIKVNGHRLVDIEDYKENVDDFSPYLTWYHENGESVTVATDDGGSGEGGVSFYVRNEHSNYMKGKEWYEVSIDLPMLEIGWEMRDAKSLDDARDKVDRFYERNEEHIKGIIENEKQNSDWEWS